MTPLNDSAPLQSPNRASLPSAPSRWRAIGQSWLALKRWVKVWLFALNVIFLAALALWPESLARWTILAYFAAGPLLLALMARQRGLTRLLGLAHLIPWTPLFLYLILRLTGDLAGPRIGPGAAPALFAYALLLLAALSVCLTLDAIDVVRWIRGERTSWDRRKLCELARPSPQAASTTARVLPNKRLALAGA